MSTNKAMQTVLIVHPNEKKRQQHIDVLCDQFHIHLFDKYLITPEEGKEKTQTIGIKTVRQLKQTLYLMPNRGDKKAIIIPEANLLTAEAQNALLKTLEEPPEHTMIILAAPTEHTLLQTIISRCTVEKLNQASEPEIDEKEFNLAIDFLRHASNMSITEKLVLAEEKASSKENAASWITTLFIVIEKDLQQNRVEQKILVSFAKNLFETKKILTTTNANPRLTIERFLMNL